MSYTHELQTKISSTFEGTIVCVNRSPKNSSCLNIYQAQDHGDFLFLTLKYIKGQWTTK